MARTTRYKEDMPAIVLEKMKNGTLPAELPGVLGVAKEDVLSWLRDARKIEFRDAFKIGMASSEAFWARMGLEALTSGFGKTFKEKLYLYILESQFGWNRKEMEMDKVEREAVMSDEELDARLEELLGPGSSLNVVPISQSVKGRRKAA